MITPTNAFAPFIGGPGLFITVDAGSIINSGANTFIPAAVVSLAANATSYVYLDTSAFVIAVSTSGFPTTAYPIVVATTGNTGVLNLIDARPDVGGTGAGSSTPVAKCTIVVLNAAFESGTVAFAEAVYVSANRAMRFDTTNYTQLSVYFESTTPATGFALASVSVSGNQATYNFSLTQANFAANGGVGLTARVLGFTNAGNNSSAVNPTGLLPITASTNAGFTVTNASAVSETHAAVAVTDTIRASYIAGTDLNGNFGGTIVDITGSDLPLSSDNSAGRSFLVGPWTNIPAGMQNADVWLLLKGLGGQGTTYSSQYGMRFR